MPRVEALGPLSPGRRNAALGLLVLVYTSNFIDRTILSVLAQPIKDELALADWQLGVLGGLSFAIFYSVLGLPIARLAERVDRTWIIASALVIWSGMTALCGAAATYAQLVLCRIGVGVGEAGCTPPAQSLLSDYFPPERRATALSIYGLGVPIGSMLGAVLGGMAAQAFGWRAAFLIVGLPGLLLAVVAKLVLKEAPRGYWEGGVTGAPPPLNAVLRTLWAKRSFRHLAAGITLASFAGYALVAFTASYFLRTHQLSLGTAGLVAGLVAGLAAGAGTIIGGLATDAAGRRDRRWYVWIPAIGLFAATPLYWLAYSQADWRLAAGLLILPGVFHYAYLGPTYAVMHNMVDARMRATATALMLLVVNLIGLGLGPTFAGLVSDLAAAWLYGGSGTACHREVEEAACLAASAEGLRVALLVSVGVFLWSGWHYLMAGKALREDLRH